MTLEIPNLYKASSKPEWVEVPKMNFLMVDGTGDPNTAQSYKDAVEVLYGMSYTLKFALKKTKGLEYKVGPLEGLWWTPDMKDFSTARKDDWLWTMMIVQPDAATPAWVEKAKDELRRKKNPAALDKVRLQTFHEGKAAQVLYIGPYSDEGPTIQKLHDFIHAEGYRLTGKHHEIYLGDPRRSAPEKLKTIIRQPARK